MTILRYGGIFGRSPTFEDVEITGDLSLGDGDKIQLGDSADLQIYHDGSNNYIDGTNGAVFVKGSRVDLRGANNEIMLVGNQNGNLVLYYDNSSKLATTSTGIDVTGTVVSDGLTVAGASGTIGSFTNSSDADLLIKCDSAVTTLTPTTGTLALGTSSTERMRINSNGNVGIGTTSPNFTLHLDSKRADATYDPNDLTTWADFKIQGQTAVGNARGIYFDFDQDTGDDKGSGIVGISQDAAGGVGELGFITTTGNFSYERMRIDRYGNVGIGTKSPQDVLDLGDATGGKGIAWGGPTGIGHYSTIWSEYGTASIVIGAGLKGSTTNADFIYPYTGTIGYAAIELDSFSNDGIKFYTAPNGSRTKDAVATKLERMRIDTSGNVGIGTTVPSASLSISKQTTALSGTGNSYGLYLYPTSSGATYVEALTGGASNTDLKLRSYNNGTYNQLIGSSSGGTVTTFQTGGSERMRLDNDGLKFNGDTAAANALGDYEEGTWTPTLPNGGTLNVVEASYVKIGDLVTVGCHLSNIAPTNNASRFEIGGLPYSTANTSGQYWAGSIGYSGDSDLSAWGVITLLNSTVCYFHALDGTSVTSRTNAQYLTQASGSTDSIIFSVTYRAA